ncbi:hypothetical protein M885DRAFT_514741, partial [Pelagophyceae sp. CCMP2097]
MRLARLALRRRLAPRLRYAVGRFAFRARGRRHRAVVALAGGTPGACEAQPAARRRRTLVRTKAVAASECGGRRTAPRTGCSRARPRAARAASRLAGCWTLPAPRSLSRAPWNTAEWRPARRRPTSRARSPARSARTSSPGPRSAPGRSPGRKSATGPSARTRTWARCANCTEAGSSARGPSSASAGSAGPPASSPTSSSAPRGPADTPPGPSRLD